MAKEEKRIERKTHLGRGIIAAIVDIAKFLIAPYIMVTLIKSFYPGLDMSMLNQIIFWSMILAPIIAACSFVEAFYWRGSAPRLVGGLFGVLFLCIWIYMVFGGTRIHQYLGGYDFWIDISKLILLIIFGVSLKAVYLLAEFFIYRRKLARQDKEDAKRAEEEARMQKEAAKTPLCPQCGQPSIYYEKYQAFYCYDCTRYLDDMTVMTETAEKCPTCGSSATYSPQYDAYYCFQCDKYTDDMASQKDEIPGAEEKNCPTCGSEAAYYEQYNAHYCKTCKGYLHEMEDTEEEKVAEEEEAETKECPKCGADATYYEKYKAHYCKNCKGYLHEMEKEEAIEAPEKDVEKEKDMDEMERKLAEELGLPVPPPPAVTPPPPPAPSPTTERAPPPPPEPKEKRAPPPPPEPEKEGREPPPPEPDEEEALPPPEDMEY